MYFSPLEWVGGHFWYFLPQIYLAQPVELATFPVYVPSVRKDDKEITDFLLCSLGFACHLIIVTVGYTCEDNMNSVAS